MPRYWNNADPRAVVVNNTPSAGHMNEVVDATPYGVLGSPGPIAVGIYAFDSPLPLRYVPDGVISNVDSGWYTPILLTDHPFAVVITPTPHAQAFVQQHSADALAIYVEVNGAIAHPPGRIMDVTQPHECVLHGFTLANHSRRGHVAKTIKRFVFPKESFDIVVTVNAIKFKTKTRKTNESFEHPNLVDSLAGDVTTVQRFTYKRMPKTQTMWPLDECNIRIRVRPRHWLLKNHIFTKQNIDQNVWLTRQSAHYLYIGTTIQSSNASKPPLQPKSRIRQAQHPTLHTVPSNEISTQLDE